MNDPKQSIHIEVQCDYAFEQWLFTYCQEQPTYPIEDHIKVSLSAFHAPFAAKAAGKSPERVRALAEYSIKQLEAQLNLINALFLQGKKTQNLPDLKELSFLPLFDREKTTIGNISAMN
ncbi:hypothetical protein [Lusitaniella coriacea]|uniref:hypothetical protein n=1 Tax=Lusitaniella coriacea TaxID=1983105 RepID=UPI003CED5B57